MSFAASFVGASCAASEPLFAPFFDAPTEHNLSDPSLYGTWSFGPPPPPPPNPYLGQPDLVPGSLPPSEHLSPPPCQTDLNVVQQQHRPVKRRTTANRKERRRTQSINNAFAELRDCIPNVPSDTKLSKIKTLRLATSYIAYLMEILRGEPGANPPTGFRAELSRKLERCEERRKRDLASALGTATASSGGLGSGERKGKGRTGWPQHVWALELKN